MNKLLVEKQQKLVLKSVENVEEPGRPVVDVARRNRFHSEDISPRISQPREIIRCRASSFSSSDISQEDTSSLSKRSFDVCMDCETISRKIKKTVTLMSDKHEKPQSQDTEHDNSNNENETVIDALNRSFTSDDTQTAKDVDLNSNGRCSNDGEPTMRNGSSTMDWHTRSNASNHSVDVKNTENTSCIRSDDGILKQHDDKSLSSKITQEGLTLAQNHLINNQCHDCNNCSRALLLTRGEDDCNVKKSKNEEAKNDLPISSKTYHDLQEQVVRQADMIRVLQEQVRSLLRMNVAVSSEKISDDLPLTPTSTSVSAHENHCGSPATVSSNENFSKVDSCDHVTEKVTIGVNTGSSLLCEPPSHCCTKSEEELLDNEPKDEQNTQSIFPTPDKTASVLNNSEVDVPSQVTDAEVPVKFAQGDGEVLNEDVGNEKILQNEKVQMKSEKNIKGREFYDRLLHQVQDLLSEQVDIEEKTTEDKPQQKSQSCQNIPSREVVVQATLKQLEKIKQLDDGNIQLKSSMKTETNNHRSLSTSFIPEHPRLNFVSMSVDDTFDEMTCIDDVALKYLSEEELKNYKHELKPCKTTVRRSYTRTVRFGSLPSEGERKALAKRNTRETDFTWNNLSFSTKNYLTKYNLVEGSEVSLYKKDEDTKQEISREKTKATGPSTTSQDSNGPVSTPNTEHHEVSSHILDIQRLKNLPKLF